MEKILVAVDFSQLTPPVVEHAADVARATGAEVWVLHVAPPEPDFAGRQLMRKVVGEEVPEKLMEQHRRLQEIEADLRGRGLRVGTRLVQGEPAACILTEARILGADYIVMGSHGRGALYRAFVGSVCEGVLRGSPCPLVVIPRPQPESPRPAE